MAGFAEREAKKQLLEEALVERAEGKKPLKVRLKEFVGPKNNFRNMAANEKKRRKKVKRLKNQEATQRNMRSKVKHQ